MDQITGLYESMYGDVIEYYEGSSIGYNRTTKENIPKEFIDFKKFICELKEEHGQKGFPKKEQTNL